MRKCFVIKPFDKDKFDNRYNDIFKPAIEECGLIAYRSDKDENIEIPIEEIEKGIKESRIVLAEISTDNPNVWYELGYAIACNKDVILICSDERYEKFPFDVQHRRIIEYKTGSVSDFHLLKESISRKINAILDRSHKVERLNTYTDFEQSGLSSHEINTLVTIMENQFTEQDSISAYDLVEEMIKRGFTKLGVSIAIRKLLINEMIKCGVESDYYRNEYNVYQLTKKGEEWVINNENQFVLEVEKNEAKEDYVGITDDEIPF